MTAHFSFIRNCQAASQTVCTLLHSHQQQMSLSGPTSSPALGVVSVLDFSHSDQSMVVAHPFTDV